MHSLRFSLLCIDSRVVILQEEKFSWASVNLKGTANRAMRGSGAEVLTLFTKISLPLLVAIVSDNFGLYVVIVSPQSLGIPLPCLYAGILCAVDERVSKCDHLRAGASSSCIHWGTATCTCPILVLDFMF